MSSFGRVIIIHKNGKDGPTYFIRQRLCTIGKDRKCNIRMNLDEVADQHAWITVDSKNQVWIANSSDDKELRINTKSIAPGGKPVILHHNSIIFIEGRAFRFEEGKQVQNTNNFIKKFLERESCLQGPSGSDESPAENMVVENSPVKEKRSAQISGVEKPASAPRADSTSNKPKISSGHDRASGGEVTANVGKKRTLSQSFDHVESSPSKRQRTNGESIAKSAEIPTNSSSSRIKLTTAREEKPVELPAQILPSKSNPLHKVRFLLPGQQTTAASSKSSSGNSVGNETTSHSSVSAPTSPVKKIRIQTFDDSNDNSGWMRKMKKNDQDDDEEDYGGITSSELDRISLPTTKRSKSPKKERSSKKENKEKKDVKEKKKQSTPSTSPQKKRARSPSPHPDSSDESEEERRSKSSKKKSSSKDRKKDKKSSKEKDGFQSKIRNIESTTMKPKSSKKPKADESDEEVTKKSKKHKSKKSHIKVDEKEQMKKRLRVRRRSKKQLSLSTEESKSSEEYDYMSEEVSDEVSEESVSSVASSDDFQDAPPKRSKSVSPKKRRVEESLESISQEESDVERRHKAKSSKKRKLQVESVKPKHSASSHSPAPKKSKKRELVHEEDNSGEQPESRHSEEEEVRKETKRESFKAFLKPMLHKKPVEIETFDEDEETPQEKVKQEFPPNRPMTVRTYEKKGRTDSRFKIEETPPRKAMEVQKPDAAESDDGDDTAFLRLDYKKKEKKPASPIVLDSASHSPNTQTQSKSATNNLGSNPKSFVVVHCLPSQMTQKQSLYSPQLSLSPSEEQGANEDLDADDNMSILRLPAEVKIENSVVTKEISQQGASMSLFSEGKEDDLQDNEQIEGYAKTARSMAEDMNDQNTLVVDAVERAKNNQSQSMQPEEKDGSMSDASNKENEMAVDDADQEPMNEGNDRSTLAEDNIERSAKASQSQHISMEIEEKINNEDHNNDVRMNDDIMEASTLIVDTAPDVQIQRQGSRSISKSKSNESVNTSLMSHEGNVSSAATNPLSTDSGRSTNTAKLDDTTHTTSTSIGALNSAVSSYESLSFEERIELIKPKMKTDEVNSVEDLRTRLIVAVHALGCDEPHLLDTIMTATYELLPESYIAITPNWQDELVNAMPKIFEQVVISDVQYFHLKLQYRKNNKSHVPEKPQDDDQEQEQTEQQYDTSFEFIRGKPSLPQSTSLNSQAAAVSMSAQSEIESDQIMNVHEDDNDEDLAKEDVNGEFNGGSEDLEPEEAEKLVHERKDVTRVTSLNMSQYEMKIVNYSSSENASDQEPKPSPSDEELISDHNNNEGEDSSRIQSQKKSSQREMETQHYSQHSRKSNDSNESRHGSQQSQPRLTESGSKIRSPMDRLRTELKKGMEIIEDIVTKKKEPNAIRKWKKELNIEFRDNYLLCGGITDDEVRMLLKLLIDALPHVPLDFIVAKVFSTAVVTIVVGRNPRKPHKELMQAISQRVVALSVTGVDVAKWQLSDVFKKDN